MLLSNFIHRKQRKRSDCLVACAKMALEHIGIRIESSRLSHILKAGDAFTLFSNLHLLSDHLGLSLTLKNFGDLDIFETYLEMGLPVIVAVKTLNWEHWENEVTEHAVVVIGIDQEHDLIYIHDPFFEEAPISMSSISFEAGWIEKDQIYAVLGLIDPELKDKP